ncbi:TPA: hypothetical protein N0F65_008059 [Lagenidium giganteum]|uniref:G-protein coupled receptors family 3 profile domain-containing protein n=1 Tax=Lagenidium giganteum TaxID=4803 RepID=A0AAV2YT18_9STRA|nr:TPA: hypothetical protein N0F65_008059 [Lagenidium giganteum]
MGGRRSRDVFPSQKNSEWLAMRTMCVVEGNRVMRWLVLPLLLLLCSTVVVYGAKYAPNHFIGTCFDDAWVRMMEQKLGVSATERDVTGRLVYPFLHPALKHQRFRIEDPRTKVDQSTLFTDDCVPPGAVYYGAGSKVNESGDVTDHGAINGTLIVELKGWDSHAISTMVFAILAQEMLGYSVSFYRISNSLNMAQRMSSVGLGACSPVHANVEVWADGKQSIFAVYANESYFAGGIGYFGHSGLFTTQDFVIDGLNSSKYKAGFDADFYRSYARSEELIQALPVSRLRNNSKYFPPTEVGCANNSFGCLNHCSKSYACTLREKAGKECLVTVLMYDVYDLGYLQSAMSNNHIPTYFCFLGYDGALKYIVDAQANHTPVVFYHYEPDTFHYVHADKFQRVFLPRPLPELVLENTGTFGENGYGKQTSNPVHVDFPTSRLDKYAPTLIQDNQPMGSFLGQISVTELYMAQLLKLYVNVTSITPPVDDAYFSTACTWLRENYDAWKIWLDRLPLCEFNQHIAYTISGCEGTNNSAAVRTITFAWNHPDPDNSSLPYNCDGGFSTLPEPLISSRPHQTYTVQECAASAKRTIKFSWRIPNANNASQSGECAGGMELAADEVITCDYMPYNNAGFIVFLVLTAILGGLLTIAMVFVFRYRDKPIIKRSQFEFLELMLLGGIVMCGAVILYAGKPTRFVCGARPAFISLGFTMIFGSLVVKSLRVYRVFNSSAMKRVVLTTWTMFKIFLVFFCIDIIILLAWFIIDFPEPAITLEELVQLHGGSVGNVACKSSSFIFSALLIFWKAIVLGMGLYISFLIRHLSTDFQESTWIFASSIVVLFGSLIMLPLAYLVKLEPATFFMFLATVLLFYTALAMGMMLLPKVMRLNEQAAATTTEAELRPGSGSTHGGTTTGGGFKSILPGVDSERDSDTATTMVLTFSRGARVRFPALLGAASTRNSSQRHQSSLAYRVFTNDPAPSKTALVMHGILGNKLNWRTFSMKLAAANPGWQFIAVDHRGHGDSPSFTRPHNLDACVNDILSLTDELGVEPDAVFGHSFGGKVALNYVAKCDDEGRQLPKQVWVLDSLPGTSQTDYARRAVTASIEYVLPRLKEIPLPIHSKPQLIADLQSKGIGLGEAQWLTTNLRLTSTNPETYVWKMDVHVIEELFQSFLTEDFWPLVCDPPHGVDIHFVQAERSKMWTPAVVEALQALASKGIHHHVLEKADHWVHIDNPNGLLEMIQENM